MNHSIAVIIPIYNSEDYLDYVFESLINQTVEANEIICIDDGSTDQSKSIILAYKEQYTDQNISYFYKENGGTASACNLGVKQATSDYIIILGSDDILLKQRIEKDRNILIKKEYDLLFSPSYTFSNDSKNLKFLESNHKKNQRYLDKNMIENAILQKIHLPTNVVTLKRNLWMDIGGYDETIKYSEDYEFWLRFFLKKPSIYYHENGMSAFRFSADHQSKSKSFENKLKSRIQILEKFFSSSENSDYLYLKEKAYALMFETLANDHWADKDFNKFRKYARKAIGYGFRNISTKTKLRFIKSFFK